MQWQRIRLPFQRLSWGTQLYSLSSNPYFEGSEGCSGNEAAPPSNNPPEEHATPDEKTSSNLPSEGSEGCSGNEFNAYLDTTHEDHALSGDSLLVTTEAIHEEV